MLQVLRGVGVQLVLQPHLVQRGVRRDHPGQDLDAGDQFRGGAPPGQELPERLLRPVDERVAVQALDGAVHPERRRQVRVLTGPGVVGDRGEAGAGFQPVQPVHPVRPVPVGVPRPQRRRGVPPGSRRRRSG